MKKTLGLLLVFCLSLPSVALAQVVETKSSLEPDVRVMQGETLQIDPLTVTEKKSIKSEIAEVGRSFKGQLVEYRIAEDQFVVAKGQFDKLNTLASLEVAVQATRKVMSIRIQVLLTYLKLMELEIKDADGINLTLKTEVLGEAEVLEQDLLRHQELVAVAVDRVLVKQAADEFDFISPRIQSLAQSNLTLLRIGKLQSIYDRSLVVVNVTDPLEFEDATPSLEFDKMVRAHAQIKSITDETGLTLEKIWAEMAEARLEGRQLSKQKSFASVYSGLNQVLVFLKELVN